MSVPTDQARRILVAATSNLGKVEEIRKLLDGQPVTLVRPEDILGHRVEVVEDGDTFEANAEIKARALAQKTGQLTLADDSGLEVDALGGAPGVHSARYAGEKSSDADNNAKLLRQLEGYDGAPLTARFRCAIAVFDPTLDRLEISSASCEGTITRTPRGTMGFGYDPLFQVTAMGNRTMAELPLDEKNVVSHRGRALRAMLPRLLGLLSTRK